MQADVEAHYLLDRSDVAAGRGGDSDESAAMGNVATKRDVIASDAREATYAHRAAST